MSKTKIKGTEIVEKRNILNEVRRTSMSLQELRFFSIYLAKINARDIKTRLVRFNLADFQKIMGFGKMNIAQIQESTNSLLTKVVNIPNENGGYTGFTLFKKCTLDKDKYGEWFIEIDANDIALPLMFNFKSHYFTYELWNALQLKSANQIRLYELLKQYEYIGKREIAVSELRELLGISKTEYQRLESFKTRVLNSCQKALSENTDICFTYERGKVGERGKWLTIVFHIRKNENYIDRLSLKDFINLQPEPQAIEETSEEVVKPEPQKQQDPVTADEPAETTETTETAVKGTLDGDFTPKQIGLLCKILSMKVSERQNNPEILKKKLDGIYSEIQLRYDPIKDPVALMLKFIKSMPDFEEKSEEEAEEDEYAFLYNNF